MRLLKLVPDDTNIDFLRWRKVASAASFLLVVISIALVAVRGLNFGIDFVGGQSVRVEFPAEMPPMEDIREAVSKVGLGEATIQQFGSEKAVSIRTLLPEGENVSADSAGKSWSRASRRPSRPQEPARSRPCRARCRVSCCAPVR
jgi:Preprotein translocase subunit SecF